VSGIALETATGHVEVLACGPDGAPLALEVEDVTHAHTRRLVPLLRRALERARLDPAELRWVAADLGPGSFTGVRVGMATAEALALASGAEVLGASSLSALALACGARRALVVPLVAAGRRDVYAGFYRADGRGTVSLLAAPLVGTAAQVLEVVAEALPLAGGRAVRFIGPGVPREREALEAAHPGSTSPQWRSEGLSAEDLARAARSGRGPAAGLPAPGAHPHPLYVRSAQAEERVRRRAMANEPIAVRPFGHVDIAAVAAMERLVFSDPWPESFFAGELGLAMVYARVAEWLPPSPARGAAAVPPPAAPGGGGPRIAGYLVAWLGGGAGHVGNLAVAPELRRRGVARMLLQDLLAAARAQGVERITLEVRVSNFAAQGLYRAHGFRLAGLRRGYYRDSGEDALLMAWQTLPPAPAPAPRSHPSTSERRPTP